MEKLWDRTSQLITLPPLTHVYARNTQTQLSPASLSRLFHLLGFSSAVLLLLTAAITLQHHVLAHGIAAGLMFVSVLGQLAVAIALQSYISSDDRDARVQCTHRAGRLEGQLRVEGKDDNDDNDENAFRIREDVRLRLLGQFHFKRWVAFSLVSMGVLATIANILLLVTGAVTEEQLQETTSAVLQYCTVAHVMASHVSYVKDMQAYRDHAGAFGPAPVGETGLVSA